MTAHYRLSKEVLHLVIRVPKQDAGLALHLLEAQDNLCFATTLACEAQLGYRDLLLRAPIEWREEILRFVCFIQTQMTVTIMREYIERDS